MPPLTNWGSREEASGRKGVPHPARRVWGRKCTWELGRDRTGLSLEFFRTETGAWGRRKSAVREIPPNHYLCKDLPWLHRVPSPSVPN